MKKFRMMSVLLSLLLCISMVAGCSMKRTNAGVAHGSGGSYEDDGDLGEYSIRIALENSESYPATLGLQVMKQYVEKVTDGSVTINIYSNGQLGGEEERKG